MTATTVNGRAVVATEEPESPLSTPEAPITYKQVLRLLLDDESVVYGCAHCDHTADSVAKVRAHLHVHTGKKIAGRPPKTPSVPADVLALTLAELVERAQRGEAQFDVVFKLQEDRDHWKARAKDAEKRLNTLRNALK